MMYPYAMPRLLDLFCGAGGASEGYRQAGFEVVGVDINPQPHYPFTFHQADALTFPLDGFDVIHASPPCQKYSVANNIHQREHPDLIGPVRDRLVASGLPYVIENVPGAPLLSPVVVCGLGLGLAVKRHRLFESNLLLQDSPHGDHKQPYYIVFGNTVMERGTTLGRTDKNGPILRRNHVAVEYGRQAMECYWMNRKELSQAIPPAYTRYIGQQIMLQL